MHVRLRAGRTAWAGLILMLLGLQGCLSAPPAPGPVASPGPTVGPGVTSQPVPPSPEPSSRPLPPALTPAELDELVQQAVGQLECRLVWSAQALPKPLDAALLGQAAKDSGLGGRYRVLEAGKVAPLAPVGLLPGSLDVELELRLATQTTRALQYARLDLVCQARLPDGRAAVLELPGNYVASPLDVYDAACRSLTQVLARARSALPGLVLDWGRQAWSRGLPCRLELPAGLIRAEAEALLAEFSWLPRCPYARLADGTGPEAGALPWVIEFAYAGFAGDLVPALDTLVGGIWPGRTVQLLGSGRLGLCAK